MPIPDYQSIFLPLLQLTADGKEHFLRDAHESLAGEFQLTEQERRELLPSGRQATFANRVGWARTYLAKAGLIERTRRGHFRITERGRKVLADRPRELNVTYLEQFSEFVEFRNMRSEKEKAVESSGAEAEAPRNPDEALEGAYQALRGELAADLLATVKSGSPTFFERLVVDLLVRMGYGGSRKEAGMALGRAGDGGVDGMIKEDRLGLDVVYIQAKRWENVVGRPEVQKFAGALQGVRARKGIFLTTHRGQTPSLDT